jgi:hypothetical protein
MSTPPAEGAPSWEPANEVELAMLQALLAGDQRAYFQLLGGAQLYLPQVSGLPAGDQRFVTVELGGSVYLPVFTSVQALAARAGRAYDSYTVTSYLELRRKWPDPDWRLAVNIGTPLDVYMPIDAVADVAMGDLEVPTAAELMTAAEEEVSYDEALRALRNAEEYPDEDPLAALRAAGAAGDAYGFLDRLLDLPVLIPVARPVPAEAILEDDFPWLPTADRWIEVFTSREELERSHPEPVHTVEAALTFVSANWPAGHGLRVDPGSEQNIELADYLVPLLVTFQPPGEPAGP